MPHSDTPNRRVLIRLALVGLTLIAHAAVCTHDFINMDDPQTISDNPRLKPPSLANIAYYWKNRGLELYVPCTYTVWSLTAAFSASRRGSDYVLRPLGFHLVNLCCHALSVLIVFQILKLLALSPECAAIGAALFAVHPLQVESVAWATALKDLLSGIAALTAVWQYLRAIPPTPALTTNARIAIRPYLMATTAFAIATLSKPGAVAAVGIATILDFYLSRGSITQILRRLLPWLAISASIAVIAHHVQPAGDVADNPLVLRPLLALDAISFYLWKLCWPFGLCPDYGRRPTMVIDNGYIAWTWAIAAAVAWVAWSVRRKHPLVLAATAVFLMGLLPSLGFIPFIFQRNSTVADRYVYLAMLGPALIFGWCYCRYASARIPVAILLGAMTMMSARQQTFWTDSLRLFAHGVSVCPWAPFNHLNYAAALASSGDLEAAASQFRQTLALTPGNAAVRDSLNQAEHLLAARRSGASQTAAPPATAAEELRP
jgi:protein O-mannosyl-transferase